jgi:hypothetical protein
MPSPKRGDDLRRFLRRLPLALLAAALVWGAVRSPYNVALCWVTQTIARQVEYPRAAQIVVDGDHAILGRTDLRADSGRLRLSLTQLNFNLIPFLALVFALPTPFARGGWRNLLAALAILALSHVLGLLWHLKYFYAVSLGPWSLAHYSALSRNVYGGLRYFFDIPVTFALPLLLWVGAFPERVLALTGTLSEQR